MKQSTFPKHVTAFLFAAALAALLLSGCGGAAEQPSASAPGGGAAEQETAPAADGAASTTESGSASGQIVIPGYEALYFTAGETRQSVDFYNPEENACLFRLSLTLDGDETLWTSEDISPGGHVTTLTLSRPLDAGEYAGRLKYECFTLQGRQPLNGAEIQVAVEAR